MQGLNYLVVGTGFFGAVIAERIATDLGERVVVVEKRHHPGGNSYSEDDPKTGIECHTYGSHIFHTSDEATWKYINRFTSFNNYRHKVLTLYRNKVFQMPVNLSTINAFYGLNLKSYEAEKFITSEIEKDRTDTPRNLEEKAVSLVGRALYDAFVKEYTMKQWGTDPRLLSPDIINRLPVRYNYRSDYFDDPWQGIPSDGYGALFRRILKHRNIDLHFNTDYFSIRHLIPEGCRIIYTGPIDRYFDYRFGQLGWRALRFEKEVLDVGDYQGTSVMNYAESATPFTRIHEFRHYHDERKYPLQNTVIYREYSQNAGVDEDPFYPIHTSKDKQVLARYEVAAAQLPHVIFGGRLGEYRYLDMDKAIASALRTFECKIRKLLP